MSDRKPTSVVLPGIVVALVLLGLYVGVYYRFVRPLSYWGESPVEAGYVIHGGKTNVFWGDEQKSLRTFFTPVHWLDRRIRPQVWEP